MRDMHLETLDPAVFSPIDDTLTVVDISRQNYTCGDNLAPLVRWIERKYDEAHESNGTFELHESIDSVCARPRALEGISIASLDADTLVPYDPTAASETTTTTTTTTTPSPNLSIDNEGNIVVCFNHFSHVQMCLFRATLLPLALQRQPPKRRRQRYLSGTLTRR